MITSDTMYNVKNRSSSVVVYRIPETNLRREFQPGETKKIPFGELEKLTYQPGGHTLLEEFLQIVDEAVTNNLNVHREVEYDMSETQIRDLLTHGSLDAFLDALDFAPIGVIDLIKTMSVSLPLEDYNKRKALLEKTGFDVDKAVANLQAEKAEEKTAATESAAPTERRVKPAIQTGRRTAPNYKVVAKDKPAQENEEGRELKWDRKLELSFLPFTIVSSKKLLMICIWS